MWTKTCIHEEEHKYTLVNTCTNLSNSCREKKLTIQKLSPSIKSSDFLLSGFEVYFESRSKCDLSTVVDCVYNHGSSIGCSGAGNRLYFKLGLPILLWGCDWIAAVMCCMAPSFPFHSLTGEFSSEKFVTLLRKIQNR